MFRDFAALYRERRRHRRRPSSLESFDVYLHKHLMPYFGKLRLDTIDHARVLAWFDAATSVDFVNAICDSLRRSGLTHNVADFKHADGRRRTRARSGILLRKKNLPRSLF